MKKNLLSFFAASALLFAATSCSEDDELLSGGNGSSEKVSFQVEMDGTGPTSRALGDGTGADQLYYEVWDMNTNTNVYDTKVNVIDLGDGKRGASISLELVKGVPYDILFWAHNEANSAFDASELTAVTMKTASLKANMEAYDAFTAALNGYKVQSGSKTIVPLKRPFAQVNVGTTQEDWEKAEKLKVVIDQSLVTVKNVNTVYNVATATASAPMNLTYALNALVDKSHTFKVKTNGNEADPAYYYLGMNYMLADTDKSIKEMEIELHDGEHLINTIKIANLPIQRNYRTNVIGNLLTSDEGFDVVIDPNFEDTDHVVTAWDGSVKKPKFDETNKVWTIESASELAWIAGAVNGTLKENERSASEPKNFLGETVVLANDIDLQNHGWMPIGHGGNSYNVNFQGTFNGQEHTISNLNVTNESCAGLFGQMVKGTIKNVNIKNVTISTNHYAGAIVAWAEQGGGNIVIENCHVDGGTITVTPDFNSGIYDNGDKAGGLVGFLYAGTIKDSSVKNLAIAAYRDLGGIAGYATKATVTGNVVENVSMAVDQSANPYKDAPKDANVGEIIGRTGEANTTTPENTATNVTIASKISSTDVSLATEPEYDETTQTVTADNAQEFLWFLHKVNGTLPAETASGRSVSNLESVPANFSGYTFKLGCNVDLGGVEWTPIGNSTNNFQGTFDGGGHIISNLSITGNNSNVGLFGYTTTGEIKNLTVNNAKVSGRLNVGVVAGTPYTSKYTDIKVTGHVEVNGMAYVGAVGGKNAYADWSNITVDVEEGSYVKANSVENGTAYRTYVGGVIGFMGEGGHKVSDVTSNIDVVGSTCDVGGIVGIAHYGNTFENVECSGDVEITDATEAGDAEEIGGIAGVWMDSAVGDVTFTGCSFTGNLRTNITEGVDLSDNTITGKAYYGKGAGNLIIDGVKNISTGAELKAALEAGVNVKLMKNIVVDADETIIIESGISSTLDMNEMTISSTNTRTATHNFFIDVKGGTLNIKNGTITYSHTGSNMGWNGATTIIDVTAGGMLEMKNVVVENLGGTDMNFAVHMNNWGEVTLNADNCEFLAPYCGVRVFNSGFDKNDVTIKNSKLTGATRAFWVHNYIGDLDSSKHTDDAIKARLSLDFFNNNNIFEITGEAVSPIRYGFSKPTYYVIGEDADYMQGPNAAKYVAYKGDAKEVTVPAQINGVDVTETGSAFAYTSVTKVTFPSTLKTLGGYAFQECTSLAEVNLPEGLETIGNRAFRKCTSLKSVSIPSTTTEIVESAFQQSGIISITIPNNVTHIGKMALGACSSLETIIIEAKNVGIGDYCARACANLKKVIIKSETISFVSGSMYFTNKENADASGITFNVSNKTVADALFNAMSPVSGSYGLKIVSLDGNTEFYNTLK